jgi:hypothetical protein
VLLFYLEKGGYNSALKYKRINTNHPSPEPKLGFSFIHVLTSHKQQKKKKWWI